MFRFVIAAACLGVVAGCGGPGASESVTEATSTNGPLAQVGALYHDHWELKKKAPTGHKDLSPYAELMPEGFNALKNGDIIAFWGVKLEEDPSAAAGDEVLAYQKEAPESGGFVLTRNRKIKQMTAAEFQAAPKADGTIEDVSKTGKKKK